MAETSPREYILLWWTMWFNNPEFENRLVDKCGLPYQCRMTHDRSKVDQAKVILFHAQDTYATHSMPNEQDTLNGEKAWVLYSLEAPQVVEYDPHLTTIFSHKWTVSRQADFADSYFTSGVNGFLKDVLQTPQVSLEEKNRRRRLPREVGGIAPVSWVVSNCFASNHRANYVRELAKHIDIDIYGRCDPHLPWPKDKDGKDLTADEIVAPYKFYLAFENSNCDDYVTEKLHRPLRLGNVPVVDGPRNYSRFSPTDNALIQTDRFENAALLAKYLKMLDSDDEAYLSHLRYRVPKDPNHTPTLKDLSPTFVKEWYNEGRPEDWGTDGHGTNCKVCKLAHDMEEGLYQFNVTKRIGLDTTCQHNKHLNVIHTDDSGVSFKPLPPSSPDVAENKNTPTDLSTGVSVYLLILPILMLIIIIFCAMISRRLRRFFIQPKQSEDKDVLLSNVQP